MLNTDNKYADIINLPHHISKTRPKMPMIDRAAQFSPFAALSGYDEQTKETARVTDKKIELDENEKSVINDKLLLIKEYLPQKSFVSVTYFEQDLKKSGGKYVTVIGVVKKIDEYNSQIKMSDGNVIAFDDVISIDSELFKENW